MFWRKRYVFGVGRSRDTYVVRYFFYVATCFLSVARYLLYVARYFLYFAGCFSYVAEYWLSAAAYF